MPGEIAADGRAFHRRLGRPDHHGRRYRAGWDRLWREKRGEREAEGPRPNLVVQLGSITEDLNRTWYERNSGNAVEDVQRRVRHPVHKWIGADLWMAGSSKQEPCSKQKPCCPGISRRKQPPKSTWPSCSTTCG